VQEAQIKLALDATIALNGENYVFWGGREGYMSLIKYRHGSRIRPHGTIFELLQEIMQDLKALKGISLLSLSQWSL